MFVRWSSLHAPVAMIVVVFVSISLSGCNQYVGNAKDAPSNATATKVTRQFEVEGMHCAGCASLVATTLEAVPGIKSATVSFEARKASVVTEGEQPATSEIEKAISDLGFKPRLLDPSNEPPTTAKP
ncbi:MAG: heavy metal-associated domain-containing protein [Thermoguttaceae bacterium]